MVPPQFIKSLSRHGNIAMWVLRVGVAMLVVATFLRTLCSESVDSLYMLASGRWMAENGTLQLENVASAVPGMRIVVQNWLLCLIYWRIYELGLSLGIGFFAVRTAHMFSIATLFLLVWRMAKSVSRHPATPWITLGVAACGYSLPSIRIHVLATLAMVACMWITNQVMGEKRPLRWLALIPLICVIHANMQSSMAALDALMALCVAILHPMKSGRRNKFPIVIGAIALGCLGSLVTPYGIDGVLYAGSIRNVREAFKVMELAPMVDFVGKSALIIPCATIIFAILVLSSMSAIRNHNLNLLAPCLMTGGCLAVSFFITRMLLQANAAAIFLAMLAMDEVIQALPSYQQAQDAVNMDDNPHDENDMLSSRRIATVAMFLGVSSVVTIGSAYSWTGCHNIADLCSGSGIEPITFFYNNDETPWPWASLIEGESQKVLCSPNMGSYMEFLGHKVTVSSRWEVWSEPCTVSPDILKDTASTLYQQDADKDVEGLVGGVACIDWDYAVISTIKETKFCDWLSRQPDWEEVPQNPIKSDWEPYVPSDQQPDKTLDTEIPYRVWRHVSRDGGDTLP